MTDKTTGMTPENTPVSTTGQPVVGETGKPAEKTVAGTEGKKAGNMTYRIIMRVATILGILFFSFIGIVMSRPATSDAEGTINKAAHHEELLLSFEPGLKYQVSIRETGKLDKNVSGEDAGMIDSGNPLQSVSMQIVNATDRHIYPHILGIEYRVHVRDDGWDERWRSDGISAGTVDPDQWIDALQIRLTGEIADNYDIRYRVHEPGTGWLDWTENGKTAGTIGSDEGVDGITVEIVKKN
ncbi:MAG: hypothetical protein Q4B73_06465 [Lachnospiraceae bacterium]|nr:hypothetical protein [Lachnospiraceae bacterium]